MKNQTCIWSEEPSHLKGRISEDREDGWKTAYECAGTCSIRCYPPPMTTFMMSVIKDGGLGCTGCAPANEIWNRASEHMSREWLIRGIYCENLNEILAKSIFEEPYVSTEGVGAGGATASRCLTDWATQQAWFCESTLSEEQVQTQGTFPLACNLPRYTVTHVIFPSFIL